MQINNSLPINNIIGDLVSAKRQQTPVRQQPQDQVSLSTDSSSKLSQLQAAYEAGTYNVSPSQIANSILNDAMQSS